MSEAAAFAEGIRPRVKISTLETYAVAMRPYRQWCRPPSRGERPERWLTPFPAEPDTVAAYVDHLCQLGLAPAYIMKIKSGIMMWHRIQGLPVPDGKPASRVLSDYHTTLRDSGYKPATAEPLSLEQVVDMLTATDRARPQGQRDAALLFLAYAAALEPGQLVALTVADVTGTDAGLLVNRPGVGPITVPHWRYAGEHHPALCPVETVLPGWGRNLAGEPLDSPLIRSVDRHGHVAGVDDVWAGPRMPRGGGLVVRGLLYAFAGLVVRAGLDPRRYRWESLKRGGLINRRLNVGLTVDALAVEAGVAPTSPMLLALVRAAEQWAPRSTAGAGALFADVETGAAP